MHLQCDTSLLLQYLLFVGTRLSFHGSLLIMCGSLVSVSTRPFTVSEIFISFTVCSVWHLDSTTCKVLSLSFHNRDNGLSIGTSGEPAMLVIHCKVSRI